MICKLGDPMSLRYPVWMWRVNEAFECVMNELCLIWMSHVTHVWVLCTCIWMRRMNESYEWGIWMSCVSYEWVTSHIWMRYVTLTYEFCDIWRSAVKDMNESRLPGNTLGLPMCCNPVIWLNMSCDIWMYYATHVHASRLAWNTIGFSACCTLGVCVVWHMNESCHTYGTWLGMPFFK